MEATRDGDVPGDESPDEDPGETNLGEDLDGSGAEAVPETEAEIRPKTRPGWTGNRRYGLKTTLQPPERLGFARNEQI